MASSPSSVKPLESAKENILGITLSLEKRFGCVPRNDIGTTLNAKFGVFPDRLPVNDKVVNYFCWGVGGRQNDTETLSSAIPVLGTNLAPYAIRPFRVVPFESDLSAPERANYAMREVRSIGGTLYCLYWLKKIVFSESSVIYTRLDPVTNITTPYDIDLDGLSPVPPTSDDNGVVTDVMDQVSVRLPGTITITGQEVYESCGVMDNGDTRFAIASELGYVSASTELVSAVDINDNAFSYNEAIMAQMVDHYTWVGQPFINEADSWTRSTSWTMRNLIGQG